MTVRTITITLTDRRPVRIAEESWPVLAKASDSGHDNKYECQANRTWKWFLCVRQHADGRAIVYATYSYSTAWQNESDQSAKHGELLLAGCTTDDIVAAIHRVADRMPGDDRWSRLADDCIADLPAEELA